MRFEDVDATLRGWGISGNKGEKQELAKILWQDERLVFAVNGNYNNANGLLVATSQRIIFLDKTFTGRVTTEDFPYDRVTGVAWNGGWTLGSINVVAASHRAEIKNVNKKAGPAFVEQVRALMNAPRQVNMQIPEPSQATDIASQLERLAALKERGVLTEEEFAQQKAKLLAG